MAEQGITLFVIACEPSLSRQYMHALDFYKALTHITSGQVLPLLMADKLGDYIVGTAIETIETEELIREFEDGIVNDVYANAVPVEKVAENLQQFMKAKGTKINTILIDDVYAHSPEAAANVQVWDRSNKISDARGKIQTVPGSRIQPQFLTALHGSPAIPRARPRMHAPEHSSSGAATGPPKIELCLENSLDDDPGFSDSSDDDLMEYGFTFQARAPIKPKFAPKSTAYGSRLESGKSGLGSTGSSTGPEQSLQVSLTKQELSQAQAQHIVKQSIARKSKVTAGGMFSRESGRVAKTESAS